jgi:hypothetical protein
MKEAMAILVRGHCAPGEAAGESSSCPAKGPAGDVRVFTVPA